MERLAEAPAAAGTPDEAADGADARRLANTGAAGVKASAMLWLTCGDGAAVGPDTAGSGAAEVVAVEAAGVAVALDDPACGPGCDPAIAWAWAWA